MKYIVFQLLLLSILFTFDVDDWTYFKKTGSIQSIIEDDDATHFITSNGIYSYNDIDEKYYYNFNLSEGIDFSNMIYHFYFDPNTNMYWFVDEYGIKMKHSFHNFWSEISYRKLKIVDVNEIISIGSSSNYIWIKLLNRLIPLNQITGYVIDGEIDYNEMNNIKWNNEYDFYNSNNYIDLSQYVIFDDWDITYNKIINNRGEVLVPTAFLEDQRGNIWIGTDSKSENGITRNKGVLLKGSSYSHRLEIVDFGLKFSDVTVAVIDKNMNWWFGDSQFLRTGIKRNKQNFKRNSYDFLAKWNQYQDIWEYIETDYSMLIQNIDVNDILSINDIVYIATMDGLLIFDDYNNDWMKIDIDLYDSAVWDIEYYDNSIYVATAKGYSEISTISNQIINNEDALSQLLKNSEIYDILINDNSMYIASEKGLFEKSFNVNTYKVLSDRQFRNIDIYKNFIFANDTDLWKINLTNLEIDNFESNIMNFSISGDFIWLNHRRYCELENINSRKNWFFNCQKEISGSMIYKVESNNDKVWFMTNDGITIYDWDSNDYE